MRWRLRGQGIPTDVFFVCALMGGIWLALQGFGRFRTDSGDKTQKSG